jgi:hypothetical protein
MYTDKDYTRFSEKVVLPVDTTNASPCWTWSGAQHGQGRGYGKFRLNGKVMSAHKASHLLFNGAVGDDQVVAHLCNNEHCVSPHHLECQSQSENMKYCLACGRHGSQR